jgi:xanthine/uracil permease
MTRQGSMRDSAVESDWSDYIFSGRGMLATLLFIVAYVLMSVGFGSYFVLELGGTDREHAPQTALLGLVSLTMALGALACVALLRSNRATPFWKRFAVLVGVCVGLAFLTFVILSRGAILLG